MVAMGRVVHLLEGHCGHAVDGLPERTRADWRNYVPPNDVGVIVVVVVVVDDGDAVGDDEVDYDDEYGGAAGAVDEFDYGMIGCCCCVGCYYCCYDYVI